MSEWISINNEFVRKEDAKVSIYDRGFLFGDGVFEGIRAYSGNVFKLKEHIERLYDSAKSILLDIPYTREQITQIVVDTLHKNQLNTAYIRIIVSRGVGMGYSLDPFVCHAPQFIVITEAFEAFPSHLYDQGLEIITVPTRRNRSDVLSPQVKSLNYLNNILVKAEAIVAGVNDGLMLNTEGYVVEGTTQNIFAVKNNEIMTPPCYLGALEGITRNSVIELSERLGYITTERTLTRHDLYTADEVFFTGTAAEIIGVIKIDGRLIGDGKPGVKTKLFFEEFKKIVVEDGVKI
ncbi:Branched-chain-amino-acid aminotransferase [Paenibacillus plantiphilus]|uniref:Branched-chain-amino-acid aminotransferase n=1 Tax=Paenibacillus plantiphilus TaxID=2905650 RepID=A0ABN8GGZ7_9BACL|nr:branched-chain-amino-acid transaminase [Paenibacillus plantiphilus]CAH1206488.1 Branched-chain-amino-acid aminotransferase [Paenibacillus plantiphilus]